MPIRIGAATSDLPRALDQRPALELRHHLRRRLASLDGAPQALAAGSTLVLPGDGEPFTPPWAA